MSRKFSLDKSGDNYTEHPKKTLDELENNSAIDLQNNIKGFIKNFPKYEGDEWARNEIFNKEFHRELKKRTMDALQGTNRPITTGRAATGLYEECQHFLETEESKVQFPHIMEVIRQLAVYSYATSRTIKMRLSQWRSKRSDSQEALNTWKKPQWTNCWPWTSKMRKKYL